MNVPGTWKSLRDASSFLSKHGITAQWYTAPGFLPRRGASQRLTSDLRAWRDDCVDLQTQADLVSRDLRRTRKAATLRRISVRTREPYPWTAWGLLALLMCGSTQAPCVFSA